MVREYDPVSFQSQTVFAVETHSVFKVHPTVIEQWYKAPVLTGSTLNLGKEHLAPLCKPQSEYLSMAISEHFYPLAPLRTFSVASERLPL